MDLVYIIANGLVVLVFILMIIRMIYNHKINKLNDRITKIFHVLSIQMLTCAETKEGLRIAQLIRREYTTINDAKNFLGLRVYPLDLTVITRYYEVKEGLKAPKRIYLIPKTNFDQIYRLSNHIINDKVLMTTDSLYLEYDEKAKIIEMWFGKLRLEDICNDYRFNITRIVLLNKIMTFINIIYKNCSLKGKSVGSIPVDLKIYSQIENEKK